jgi:hypothetical protein
MKILCLNCRGLGQPEAVQEVRSLIKLHGPGLVFCQKHDCLMIEWMVCYVLLVWPLVLESVATAGEEG